MRISNHEQRGLKEAPVDKKDTSSRSKVPPLAALSLAGAVVLDTIAQLCWKSGATDGKGGTLVETALHTASQPLFLLAMLLFIPKYFNWMYVLSKVDLTYAKPFTSLSFVTVLLCSAWWLHEHITPFKVVGVGLILLGVFQVSQTESQTISKSDKS